jgi:hypothetical protein
MGAVQELRDAYDILTNKEGSVLCFFLLFSYL